MRPARKGSGRTSWGAGGRGIALRSTFPEFAGRTDGYGAQPTSLKMSVAALAAFWYGRVRSVQVRQRDFHCAKLCSYCFYVVHSFAITNATHLDGLLHDDQTYQINGLFQDLSALDEFQYQRLIALARISLLMCALEQATEQKDEVMKPRRFLYGIWHYRIRAEQSGFETSVRSYLFSNLQACLVGLALMAST
jgi:hypothetical protein